MRAHLSDAAEIDLEEIGNFIAEDSPNRAQSFVLELVERCHGLVEFSERYPVIVNRRGLEIRRCPHRDYLILYAVSAGDLEIVRIVHSARDYLRLLFPDD